VFNDSEDWRFQGKTKKLLAVEMRFGDILLQYKGKTGVAITSFRKIGSQISVLNCIKNQQ